MTERGAWFGGNVLTFQGYTRPSPMRIPNRIEFAASGEPDENVDRSADRITLNASTTSGELGWAQCMPVT